MNSEQGAAALKAFYKMREVLKVHNYLTSEEINVKRNGLTRVHGSCIQNSRI